MKKIFGLMALALSVSAFAGDIRIELINHNKDLKLDKIVGVYQSTSQSFFCTEGIFPMALMKDIQKFRTRTSRLCRKSLWLSFFSRKF